MPIIKAPSSPTFELPFLQVTGLAAPSRGARETCVWRLSLEPGAPATPHSMDREEIFVGLAGRASAVVGAESFEVAPVDVLIVPPGVSFSLANPGGDRFEAMAVLPVGGLARMPEGEPFPPPWTE
jgi:quercetin dioxygenase-like cupin family protein